MGPISTIAFYVIDDNLAILGRQACGILDLIKRVDSLSHRLDTKQQLQDAYKDVIEGIGCYHRATGDSFLPAQGWHQRVSTSTSAVTVGHQKLCSTLWSISAGLGVPT